MKSQVFISHSVNEDEKSLIELVELSCREVGLSPYLAERAFAASSVSDKLRTAIKESDFLIAVLTERGSKAAWVNQELAIACEMGKTIIPLLEQGVSPPGFVGERDQIRFLRDEFEPAVGRAIAFILKEKAEKDPLFRVQATVKDGNQTFQGILSVLETYHLHRDETSHELSREEATWFLEGRHPCEKADAQFGLRLSFEAEGNRRQIWLIVPDLGNMGWNIGGDLYIWPRILTRVQPP